MWATSIERHFALAIFLHETEIDTCIFFFVQDENKIIMLKRIKVRANDPMKLEEHNIIHNTFINAIKPIFLTVMLLLGV